MKNNKIWITNAGWKTITTRDRLQILGARLKQKQGIWYLNDLYRDWTYITHMLIFLDISPGICSNILG